MIENWQPWWDALQLLGASVIIITWLTIKGEWDDD